MENKQNQSKKRNIILIAAIICILIVIAVLGIISIRAYSKYVESTSGNATVQVAKMICEMDVQKSAATPTVINPYCVVTVRDYEGNQVTETDVNYRLEVVAKDNKVLPEFYWKNENGTIIARSQDTLDNQGNVTVRTAQFPTQTFSAGVSSSKAFTIVFLNTGEEDILRIVDFNLVAVQGRPE